MSVPFASGWTFPDGETLTFDVRPACTDEHPEPGAVLVVKSLSGASELRLSRDEAMVLATALVHAAQVEPVPWAKGSKPEGGSR